MFTTFHPYVGFCDGKNKYFFLQTRAINKNPLNRKKCIFARFLNISNLIIHYGKNQNWY